MSKSMLAFQGAILFMAANAAFAEEPAAASAASAPKSAAEQAREKSLAAFKAADTNGDGGLSQEELAKTEPNQFKVIKVNFDKMDANKDGKVTLEEAGKWLAAQRYRFGR